MIILYRSEVEEATECTNVLSPLDEDSSADSEKTSVADVNLEPKIMESEPGKNAIQTVQQLFFQLSINQFEENQ